MVSLVSLRILKKEMGLLFGGSIIFLYLCKRYVGESATRLIRNTYLIMASTVLNEAQLSILRLLGSMKTVEEVDELRQVICDYYARRVDEEVDKLWESGQWNDEKNEAVLNEHLRTPYEYAK